MKHIKTFKQILEKNKFSVKSILPKEYQDLKTAIIKTDLQLLKNVIDKVNLNEKIFKIFDDDNVYHWTPLMYVSNSGRKIINPINNLIAKELINGGAEVDIQDRNGNTPLIYAAYNDNLELVNILIKEKASLNIQDNNGNTAIQIALSNAIYECGVASQVIIDLINANADINIKNFNGETFLDGFDFEWSNNKNWKTCRENIINNTYLCSRKYNL